MADLLWPSARATAYSMPSPSVFWSARTAVSTCRTSLSPGIRFALFSANLSQNPSGRPRYIYHSAVSPHPPRAPSRCRDLSSLSASSFFSPSFVMSSARSLPECWGHRGVSCHRLDHVAQPLTRRHAQASATFPENTLASFEKAIRDGAEGIESGISP